MIPFSGQILTGMTIIMTLMGLLGWGGFVYYQEKVEDLTEKNASLVTQMDSAIDINKSNVKLINDLVADNKRQQAVTIELRNRTAAAEGYKEVLLDKLGEHDLSMLALRKPQLIENRVNNATKKVFDNFESDTNPRP